MVDPRNGQQKKRRNIFTYSRADLETLLGIKLTSTLLAIAAGADPFFVDLKPLFY